MRRKSSSGRWSHETPEGRLTKTAKRSINKDAPEQKGEGGGNKDPFLTCSGLLLPPGPPGQDELAAVVVLLAFAEETLVFGSRREALDELRRGALHVRRLAGTLAALALLGLEQHGSLVGHTGEPLQGHDGAAAGAAAKRKKRRKN